jgi:hypothetical protein
MSLSKAVVPSNHREEAQIKTAGTVNRAPGVGDICLRLAWGHKAPEIGQTSPSQGKRLGEILAGYLSCHQDFLIRGLRRRGPVRGKGQLEVADENGFRIPQKNRRNNGITLGRR